LVAPLLQECARLKILTTSRERLRVQGEIIFRVPALSLPNARRAASKMVNESDAVQLFVERAAGVLPTFALHVKNETAVAQICERLEGIALAIELAAARVSALTPTQIAARLDDALAMLTRGNRNVPRHQTLRAVLDWSYDLLSDQERALFARLAVFAGGFTLEAVEQVCGEGERERGREGEKGRNWLSPALILDVLSNLIDKSLVTVMDVEQGEQTRYRLLEPIRQYAREKLGAAELTTTQERHYTFFVQLAEEAEPKLEGAAQIEWLKRLETEHDNLRAALLWALTRDQANEGSAASIHLAGALGRFWYLHGHIIEGDEWLTQALAVATEHGTAAVRARAFTSAGTMAWRKSEFHRAERLHARALELYREADNKSGQAFALNNLGGQALALQDYQDFRLSFRAEREISFCPARFLAKPLEMTTKRKP